MDTVPRESSALLPTLSEGAPTTPVGVDALADASPAALELGAQLQACLHRRLK